MKILILANDYKTIANFRMELLERLCGDGHEVVLSLPFDSRNEQFQALGCSVYENAMTRHGTNPFAELKLIRTYKKLITQIRPDAVLTFTIKPNIYGSIASRKCKVPVLNNVTGISSSMQRKGLKQRILFFLLKYSMKKSDVIFFQNEENMQLFNKYGITGKNSVLLPGSGVNLEKHAFSPYVKECGKIKFIIVSRLREDKGFEELFLTIKNLGKRDDVEFHVVGWCEEQKYEDELCELIKEYPITFHGEKTQQEVHELISQCHCILHPSHHEGMANVLMETAAAGRPCIASDIAGCREIIADGETGYTFSVKNADSMTQAIEKFINLSEDERARMGEKAREKVEREFDRNIVVNAYIESIKNLGKK